MSEPMAVTVTVKLQDVVEHLDMLNDESAAYLNKRTGELYWLTEDELLGSEEVDEDEDEDELVDLPDWQREARLKAKEVTESDDWLELPGKFEIHEYNLMEEFCRSIEDEEHSKRMLQQIRGSGAFRRFRGAIAGIGLEQAWYQFRASALERIAVDWLDEHQIAYSREPVSEEPVK
jgi:hypothetical protein